MAPPLHDLRVMVTRPTHLAEHLAALLTAAGADVIRRPCMEIIDLSDTPENLALARALARYRLLVFVSRNAVAAAHKLLRRAGVGWPPRTPTAAVGVKTVCELQRLGVCDVVHPQRMAGSEALLEADPVKNLATGSVLVFRGEGGNELLARTLRARGVTVDYAEVYRRRKPPGVRLTFGAAGDPDVILSASSQSLRNLWDLTDVAARAALQKIPVALSGDAMTRVHARLGFTAPPIIAASPLDEDVCDAVVRWRRARNARPFV